MQRSGYDDIAAAYDAWVSESGDVLDDPVFARLVGDVAGRSALAVACGSGRDARFLASAGARVTGVDVSRELLARAQSREEAEQLGITYLQADAGRLDGVDGGSFDTVVCFMALMDIPDLTSSVAAISRVLRPGGRFVAVVTHPCFKAPATGDLVDHVDGSVRRVVGRYFEEGRWDGSGARTDRLPSIAYHRTLSTYLNTLVAAGLRLDELAEPPLDLGSPVWLEVPCLLYLRCTRTDAAG